MLYNICLQIVSFLWILECLFAIIWWKSAFLHNISYYVTVCSFCIFVHCHPLFSGFVEQNTMDTSNAEEAVVRHNVSENEPLLRDDYNVTHVVPKVHFPSCRLVLILMAFLGFLNIYCLRVNLSVAIIAMLNHTQQPWNYSENNFCQSCRSAGENEFEKDHTSSRQYDWDSNTQGIVLAAFFYGYITTQVWVLDETQHIMYRYAVYTFSLNHENGDCFYIKYNLCKMTFAVLSQFVEQNPKLKAKVCT